MVKTSYAPDRGHVVWVTLDPGRGHEQSGRRPALVISERMYNIQSGLALVCPITSQIKGYPFEVAIDMSKVRGVALVDQTRSIDWRARNATPVGRVPPVAISEAREKLRKLID